MSQRQLTDLARQAAELRLQRAEEAVEAAVLDALGRWLETVRFLIIREAAEQLGVTAAGYNDPSRAVDAASGAWNDWSKSVDDGIMPAVSVAFGEGFREQQRTNPGGSFRPESEYMATVHDRFKIWPEGAFEEVRPELVEALAESESIDQIRDRVGRVLNIDKDSRAIKADINAVEDRLMNDDTLDPQTRKELVAERRRLWKEHDAELSSWQWKARRIARTEAHGAVNAGQIVAARRRAAATGERLYKRWLGTIDARTRASHRVADGQIVELDEKFNVGGADLDFPGEAGGPAHEVINCRCSMRIEDEVTLQEQLQGPTGAAGKVFPGGVRLGPDSSPAVEQAIQLIDATPEEAAAQVRRWLTAESKWRNDVGTWLGAEHAAQTRAGLLPADIMVGAQPGGAPVNQAAVLSRTDLERHKKVAPDTPAERWKYYLPSEVDVATALHARGVQTQSVDEFKRRKSPDAVITHGGPPLEFKSLHEGAPLGAGMAFSHSTFKDHALAIARKCRRGVIDTRRTDATVQQVRAALEEAVIGSGHNLDELIAIVRLPGGNDITVSWRRGI